LGPWSALLKLVAVVVILFLARQPILWLGSEVALVVGDILHWFVGLGIFSWFAGFVYLDQNWNQIAGYFAVHLRLTVEALVISVLIAIPAGIFLNRARSLYVPTFVTLDLIYTIPSVALFAILLPFTGETDTTVLIALVAYAQFILVRNVAAGLDSVPAEIKEAARGMGMNPAQILFRVELPLALPVIVAGLRIATVATIGIAAVAAVITIPDLGTLFFVAVNNNNVSSQAQIEAGAIAVTALALGADLLLRIIERYIPANRVGRAGRTIRLMDLATGLFPRSKAIRDSESLAEDS
jgi:osmoprotectant transport system permease protein